MFTVRSLPELAGVVVGFAVAAAGGWWLITERPPRRWFGLAGAVVGLGSSSRRGDRCGGRRPPLVNVAFVLILFAVMTGSARLAMVRDLHALDALQPHAVDASPHPVLICNPWSGGGKVEKFGLVELAKELGVETVMLDHGLDLEQLARDAVARGADCLGMAGGDGSQALVASIAVECGLPFVCVSAGTRNHFALDLGIDREDPRTSLHAFRDAIERRIDYATVNGRFFVNNVSLGVYATIVQEDGYRDAKVDTTKALLPEMLGKTDKPFDLQFTAPDGTEVDGAFLIQVSNNPYALGLLPRRQAATQRRHRRARCHRPHRSHREGRRRNRHPGRRRPTQPQPQLARVHRRDLRGSLAIGQGLRRRRRRSARDDDPARVPDPPPGLRLLVPEGNLEAARAPSGPRRHPPRAPRCSKGMTVALRINATVNVS